MVLAKSDQGYFVVWATKDIFVEKIDRDLTHWLTQNFQLIWKYFSKVIL